MFSEEKVVCFKDEKLKVEVRWLARKLVKIFTKNSTRFNPFVYWSRQLLMEKFTEKENGKFKSIVRLAAWYYQSLFASNKVLACTFKDPIKLF